MTAETLKKSFLAAAGALNATGRCDIQPQKNHIVSMSANNSSTNSSNTPASDRSGNAAKETARKSAVLLSFCAIVSICMLTLIGVAVWSTMRTVQLQRDMNELKEVLQFWGLDVINLEELNDTTNGRKRPITQRPSHGFNDINDDDEYPEDYEEYNEELTVLRMSEEQYDETDDDDDETDDVELGSADDDNSDDDTDDDADDDDSNVSPMYEDVDEQKSSRKARSLTDDLTFGSIVETPPPHDILHHLIPYQELSDTEYPHSNRDAVGHSERPKSRRSRVTTTMNERTVKESPTKKELPLKSNHTKHMKSLASKKANGDGAGGVKNRSMSHMRKSLVTKSARRPPMIAVHYVGHIDANDRYHQRLGNGNGHVQHHGGVYADWKAANWSTVHGMERFFRMEHGVVTVQEAGLYQVYAQIYYYDAADESSFWVDHNEHHLLQCVTTVISDGSRLKASTCYTAGLVYLQSGDRIRVHDMLRHYALMRPERSFFGLMRLGSTQANGGLLARSDENV